MERQSVKVGKKKSARNFYTKTVGSSIVRRMTLGTVPAFYGEIAR